MKFRRGQRRKVKQTALFFIINGYLLCCFSCLTKKHLCMEYRSFRNVKKKKKWIITYVSVFYITESLMWSRNHESTMTHVETPTSHSWISKIALRSIARNDFILDEYVRSTMGYEDFPIMSQWSCIFSRRKITTANFTGDIDLAKLILSIAFIYIRVSKVIRPLKYSEEKYREFGESLVRYIYYVVN